VSCENCTHTAIAAKKKRLCKGCYTQRDSGGVWTTPEMMDRVCIMDIRILKGYMRAKILL